MDETTIFQGQNVEQQQVPQSQEVQKPLEPSYDQYNLGKPSSNIFLKLFLGLLVVLAIFLLAIVFIIPNFNKNKNEVITLTYWGVSGEREDPTSIISEFEKENPNIKVNFQKQDIKDYKDRLVTRVKNGTGPDLFLFHNTWVAQLSQELLPPPSDTISKKDFDNYPQVAQKDLIKNGAIYGLPQRIDTLALFINSEIFRSAGLGAPSNWNDFINVARSLTVKEQDGKIKTAGAALGTFDNITNAADIISLLMIQNGVDLKNMPGSLERTAGALNFYTSFAISDGNVWDSTLDQSILAFSKGELAMFLGFYRDYETIKESNPSLVFEVVDPPSLPDQKVTIASYWALGISSKSKFQKEALTLLKFLAKRQKPKLLEPFESLAKNATSSFFADATFDNGLNSQMNSFLSKAINAIVGATTSPSEATQTLSQEVSSLLGQYPRY